MCPEFKVADSINKPSCSWIVHIHIIRRIGRVVMPFVLIGLGIYFLTKGFLIG